MGFWSRFRVPGVSADEARSMLKDGAKLVDVRENQEWQAGKAPQAVHVPLNKLKDGSSRIPENRQILVICRSGNRSRSGAKILRSQGFDAYTVRGGMRAWQAAGGAVLDRKGRPGRIV